MPSQVNGVDYNFVSIEEFAKLTDENFFVETTYYNSNYYGTARKDIKDDKCIILDPNGLKSFLKLNDERIKVANHRIDDLEHKTA